LEKTRAIGWLFRVAVLLVLVGGAPGAAGDSGSSDAATAVGNAPPPCPRRWRGLLGRYGREDTGLLVRERDGRLEALFSDGVPEPLDEIGPGTLRFAGTGPHSGKRLALVLEPRGIAAAMVLDGETLGRRGVELEGAVFRIAPLRPVAELTEEALAATPPTEAGRFREVDLVDVAALSPDIRLDIRYATSENFLGTPVYRSPRALLQRPAAEALLRAHRTLLARGYGLLIHDAYRPWWVTRLFWDATPTDKREFVARPDRGSRHNRGAAVDLTLYRLENGRAVRMPGVYDEMSERSHPDYPGGTSAERFHRDLLRSAMEAEGFTVFGVEWWHFDFRDWREYPLLNVPFDAVDAPR
jgi:D-alanyl-D-alanine dipeptidase